MKIGIVGGGFVGSATALLECPSIEVIIYDLDPSRCKPPGATFEDLRDRDFVFVCVPTPTYASGECNTRIVESCIANLKSAGIRNIVLRSTVPPGTSEKLDVMFMPEFLTEANWRSDFNQCPTWIFAGADQSQNFQQLLTFAKNDGVIVSDTTIFTSSKEAELIKYTRNNFLALKISFFNEIHSLCKNIGVDYDAVRKGVIADPRIGKSHTAVPGPDGHYGYGGTCLPKDTSALAEYMKTVGIECPIVKSMVYRNMKLDRPEHDWEHDPRAFTSQTK